MKEEGINNRLSKKSILIIIFSILIVSITGTLAWLTYRSKNTAMVLTIGDLTGMSVTLKPYQINTTLTPTNDYSTQEYVNITANNKKTNIEKFELYYEIDEIATELIDDGFKYTIVKSTNNWSSQTVVKTGDFSTATSNSTLTIYSEDIPGNNTTYQYKVYLWIDSSDGNQANMQGKTFKGELRASLPIDATGANQPVLDTGMIPVKISDTGVVTAVSKYDPTWYDYNNKKWANAVLVKENGVKTRSANKNDLTTIDPSDILAYYVWIPRYSYKIWTLDASSDHTGDEQTIDIKFVNKSTKDAGTSVGDYYTHPAFTFGSQELDGFWVGKFEMSHDTLTTSTTDNNLGCTTTTCTNANGLRILPTVSSLRYNSVSNMYFATRSMEQSNNVFGITNSDSHMMKNSEWGAVAYLSHSNYGINTEIRKNNYRGSSPQYTTSTGCGANVANANTSTTVTTCAIPYGAPSNETYTYPQSTTGNISGVFDMSGGAVEYVMGNFNGTIGSSGFSIMPDSKYYDNYPSSIFTGSYSTNMTFCTLATCGGHALNETRAWYSDYARFVNSSSPWFDRGGGANNNTNAGAFMSYNYTGNAVNSYSWRGVLVDVSN